MRPRATLPVLVAVALLPACAIPRWPVNGPVTSPFGLRRDGWGLEIHRGVDISVPTGTPVRAMAPGHVRFAGTMSGYGLVVVLDHGHGLRSLYAHLSELRVTAGQDIESRGVVGLSGSTGRASGPHLHFEVIRGGSARDPVPLLGGFPGS